MLLIVGSVYVESSLSDKGAFNNYVDKKGGRGGQQKVHVDKTKIRKV